MKKKIKIGHVISSLEIDDGIQNVIEALTSEYDQEKYLYYLFVLSKNNQLKEFYYARNVKVFEIDAKSSFSYKYILKNLLAIITLISLLKKNRINIVVAHEFFSGTIGRIAAIVARVPVIFWMLHLQDFWKNKIHIFIDRFLSKFTHCIIANSNSVKKSIVDHEKIDSNKITVIHNGINLKKYCDRQVSKKDFLKEFNISVSYPIVIVIARLVKNKGHIYLLQAFNKFINNFKNAKLLIIGASGDCRDECTEKDLRAMVHENENLKESVFFLGKSKKIPDFLAISDALVLPSIEKEGFGLVITESMAMKTPVIGADIGGIPEIIINNVTGKLVSPGNSDEIYQSLLDIFNNKEKTKLMIHKAKERVENHFSHYALQKKWGDLYDKYV